jgi:hypothetical protein
MIVKGVNKSNHPIQTPSTVTKTRDSIQQQYRSSLNFGVTPLVHFNFTSEICMML